MGFSAIWLLSVACMGGGGLGGEWLGEPMRAVGPRLCLVGHASFVLAFVTVMIAMHIVTYFDA